MGVGLGTICDTLSLGDKFCFEKIHLRYCKTILGIRKTARNLQNYSCSRLNKRKYRFTIYTIWKCQYKMHVYIVIQIKYFINPLTDHQGGSNNQQL
jgi:hypothetical protein